MSDPHKPFTGGIADDTVRSDCFVDVRPKRSGGIVVDLRSKVMAMYGEKIRKQVEAVCAALGVRHALLRIDDRGALPFALAARVETAVRKAIPSAQGEFLPRAIAPRKRTGGKLRLRRTRLYLPGNEPKFIPNAGLHRPDCVVLDLEDSVAPEAKDGARRIVRNALRSIDFLGAERCVRINQGEIGLQDLRAVVPQRPEGILIPKCETAETVRSIEAEVRELERRHRLGSEIFLLPIIESALGIENAFAIASGSARICALAIGLEDYTADIGAERTAEGRESFYARMALLNAARAAGVQALDSVYSDVEDLEGLRRSTLESKALGFDGRGCIHPRQIPVIHAALAPTLEDVERASRIVQAATEAKKKGLGVVALGSKMIDAPVVARAERVLHLAALAGKGEGS